MSAELRKNSTVLTLLLSLVLTACDFGATGSGSTGDGPSVGQLSEVARAFTDDLESETGTLTLTYPGAPEGIDFVGACPDSSNSTDADADGVLDDATLTYAGAACRQSSWRGGVLAVTGSVRVTDPSQASNNGYTVGFDDLTWAYTSPTESLTYISTRNGTRSRIGDADSIVVETDETTDRQRIVITAVAHITKELTLTFGADVNDAIEVDQPLPDGKVAVEGSWDWVRSSEDWELTVSTLTPLQYDASCDEPQRFTAGRVRLTGRIDGAEGHVDLEFEACGEEPARSFTRD